MELTVEQLLEADDVDLGTSDWIRIDQERIDRFADTTEDHQWIHVDPERAGESPFGGTIAHGYLVLSLVSRLLFGLVKFPDAGAMVNFGLDKLRFMSPVPVGSEVCLKARLLSGTQRPGGVMIRLRVEIRLRESGRRALVAEPLFLVQPAPAP